MTNKEMKKEIIKLMGKNFYKICFVDTVQDMCEEELISSPTIMNAKQGKFPYRKWANAVWDSNYRKLCKEVLDTPNVNPKTAKKIILEAGYIGLVKSMLLENIPLLAND